ncbi:MULTISPECIES: 6-phosphogluconolactonase [unclassified Paenibacillus]|uniref:6-phosphogluconolactonase n=1 Tax=unclassified Paenibacillus TaxID=185978 RepID=UPI0003FFBB76|nr:MULTISPECIES: 6-phosphogluconolactonase [unclassified Paenibacillus]KGP82718.1 glucosamine-6-phosphate deaminase [Paenibacillus sp. MAEPY1]KGP83183.1 glucosamine-6-phosphate deaminase [Paenibacillus sp. MAEPY2]
MIKIFETEEEVADAIAREMKEHLSHEHPVFCLASGSTPQKSYMKFAGNAEIHERIQQLKIVSLDEWVGISRESEGSCYQMLNQDLFSLVHLDAGQIEFFDGTAPDLEQECQRIDHFINQHPITFSLMGVGMNGHIGLNEPGCPLLDHSSVVDLSETTRSVAQKYFHQPTALDRGITLGLSQVAGSKRVIVAVTGERKAGIVKEIFTNPEAKLPAQELLGYEHIDFFLDSEAAKYIKQR